MTGGFGETDGGLDSRLRGNDGLARWYSPQRTRRAQRDCLNAEDAEDARFFCGGAHFLSFSLIWGDGGLDSRLRGNDGGFWETDGGLDSRLRGNDGGFWETDRGLDSRLRGNDGLVRWYSPQRTRRAQRDCLNAGGAEIFCGGCHFRSFGETGVWIPACAGMTGGFGRRTGVWIPACAGMTGWRGNPTARVGFKPTPTGWTTVFGRRSRYSKKNSAGQKKLLTFLARRTVWSRTILR